jgi:two-component system, sensor histidine kinase and response regulator
MTESSAPRILVVDDEQGIRLGCRRALEPLGMDVETADTLADGRRRLSEGCYDAVLLDVMMPDGRGMDLLPAIADSDRETVTIIITGFATVELAVESIRRGAYDFISKPFSADVLQMTVEQALEKRRLSLETQRLQAIEQQAVELARAKDEMERLDRFKTSFMLMVAHELRAPVSALLSFLRTMAKGFVPVEKQEEILHRSIERAEELLDLINDLLNLAAARDEAIPAKRIRVSMRESLEKTAALFLTQAENRGLSWTVEPRGDPHVDGNPEQLGQVWANLISNAIKYTPDGGSVAVRLEEVDGWCVASVKDSGIGIEPELHDKIFEDFYRTPRAKEHERLGTGLGLTLAKRIIEAHGGSIELESRPGQGSRFTFRLPISTPHDQG